MGVLITSVLCGIASDVICASYKLIVGTIKGNESINKDVERCVRKKIDPSLQIVIDSALFEEFMSSPQVSDLLVNYIRYVVTGIISNDLKNVKKTITIKSELTYDHIIDYLIINIKEIYNFDIVKPSEIELRKYFEFTFNCAIEIISSELKTEDLHKIFLINVNVNNQFANLQNSIKELIQGSLRFDCISKQNEFEKIRIRYSGTIRQYFSMGFIYLMGEYKLKDFYIIPNLKITVEDEDYRMIAFHSQKEKVIMNRASDESGKVLPRIFMSNFSKTVDWTSIFGCKDIIYLTGGPGFGKSLFLINIINCFEQLEINESGKHLIIYCDLKTFCTKNADGSSYSVLEVIQESMVKYSGIDKDSITKELIEYFLNIGRCIILFDALDEVPKIHRTHVYRKITAYFTSFNPNNKICITSRSRGFFPESGLDVISICPLDRIQIEQYLDKIIKFKKFKKENKDNFLKQADKLIEKGFLNSFLVLSLLIGIYKSERELPENKIDLYRKCFEYINNKREEEKSKDNYKWELIFPLMKDSTFIALSELAAPNNRELSYREIERTLLSLYCRKFSCEGKTELAISEFLEFCSNRTELFVPASSDSSFKFFHRSFFEYFYAKKIYQLGTTAEMYNAICAFDLDSEIFEILVALLKEDKEAEYQELIQYLINQADSLTNNDSNKMFNLNILTLSMQVVDDEFFVSEYCKLFIVHYIEFIINKQDIHNVEIISNIIINEFNRNSEFQENFLHLYLPYSIFEIIENIQDFYSYFCDSKNCVIEDKEAIIFLTVFKSIFRNVFFSQICKDAAFDFLLNGNAIDYYRNNVSKLYYKNRTEKSRLKKACQLFDKIKVKSNVKLLFDQNMKEK